MKSHHLRIGNPARLKYTKLFKHFQKVSLYSFRRNILILAVLLPSSLLGQVVQDSSKSLPDFAVSFEASGFIPFRESYRINFETSLLGLPFEVAGGLYFPVNESLSGLVSFRYKRRAAVFVPDFRLKTIEIELGVHDYLEEAHEGDLRLFGSGGLLLARTTAIGNIDATTEGKNTISKEVSQDYFNIGLGLGLGIEYPLTSISGLFLKVHLGIYFADAISTGGLGNIGGLSIGLGYKIALGN